jgi:hypothetical protein
MWPGLKHQPLVLLQKQKKMMLIRLCVKICELGCSHRNNIKRRSRMKTMTLPAQDTLYLYSYYLCPHFHNDNANGVLLWAKMPNFQWTSISKCNNGLGITSKIKLMEYIHGENTLLCESSKCRKYTTDISIF